MTVKTILCPTGHLAFTPLEKDSFLHGCTLRPDYIVADAGSCDMGPRPLGADQHVSLEAWQRHDLEVMLVQARRLGVKMIVGSASDTGTDRGVDQFVRLLAEIAAEHRLAPFRVGAIYAEQSVESLRQRLAEGGRIAGLDGRDDADKAVLDRTTRAVAVMNAEPIRAALRGGADVVIAGRSSDCALFAAPLLEAGFSPGVSYYTGKLMECASFCAEPYGGKETVLGEISHEDVRVTAMHPQQRCTVASVSAHAMYERSNPYEEFFAGGRLDMTNCRYEQLDERTTRITGSRFVPDAQVRVKLEGAGKVGERYVGLCGIRDPYTVAHVDQVIAWAREQVRARFGDSGYELHYNVYGRDGVMGDLEPLRDRPGHELAILVQGVAPTREVAEEVAMIGLRQMFYARLPDVKGTAGSVSFPLDEVLRASPAYRWTVNHTLAVADPMELFPTFVEQVGS